MNLQQRLSTLTTKIGLGTAALGRPGYINLGHEKDLNQSDTAIISNTKLEQQLKAVADSAYKLGVRYFDTARSYGQGEQFLGRWLQTTSPTDTVIGSKWGYTYTANWAIDADAHEVKEHSISKLKEQWPISQSNLPNLDLYQIHSATLESDVLENTAVLKELAQIKSNGIAIGLSTSGANQKATIQKATGLTVDGVRLFDAIQSTYNIYEPSAAQALKSAHQSGLAVIVKESVANGRLTSRNPAFTRQAQTLLNKHNCTPDALAIAYCLAQPWISIVLSGASTVEQLKSNLNATDIVLSDDDIQLLDNLTESPSNYWTTRSQLAWN